MVIGSTSTLPERYAAVYSWSTTKVSTFGVTASPPSSFSSLSEHFTLLLMVRPCVVRFQDIRRDWRTESITTCTHFITFLWLQNTTNFQSILLLKWINWNKLYWTTMPSLPNVLPRPLRSIRKLLNLKLRGWKPASRMSLRRIKLSFKRPSYNSRKNSHLFFLRRLITDWTALGSMSWRKTFSC